MIAKIIKGSDFAGLMNYLTMGGRGEIIDTHFLSATDPADIAQEMALTASLSARCKKPVAHIAISYAPTDAPSVADMRADAQAALESLGLRDHAAVVIRHRDNGIDHFHVAACRIGSDGKTVHDGQSYARLEEAMRRIEAQRGWRPVPGRHAPTHYGYRKEGAPKMSDPHQFIAPEPVRQALLASSSERDLRQRLDALSWSMEIIHRDGRQPGLLLIGPSGHRIAASKIDRGVSLGNLRKRWTTAPVKVSAPTAKSPEPIQPDATQKPAQGVVSTPPPTTLLRAAIERFASAFTRTFHPASPSQTLRKPVNAVQRPPAPPPRKTPTPPSPRLH